MSVQFVWGLLLGALVVFMFRPAIYWAGDRSRRAAKRTRRTVKSMYNWSAAASIVVLLFMMAQGQGGT